MWLWMNGSRYFERGQRLCFQKSGDMQITVLRSFETSGLSQRLACVSRMVDWFLNNELEMKCKKTSRDII